MKKKMPIMERARGDVEVNGNKQKSKFVCFACASVISVCHIDRQQGVIVVANVLLSVNYIVFQHRSLDLIFQENIRNQL